ncbi:Ribonucleases P/MRP protein subunit POP1 [Strongyloides ratti]|uniref:Ribonucleases P/MRP protein subunit POP1 n=1 Tax=Strongyloides ratti TaxID=34506 RepID=A0A090LFQ8_STRRB|nr:Ribonucleases P/MRP protein subunit POP1 [Strongyloides ratti]CEF66983.1 Ribonucleases P/MRP protein subunit POP1 [Strongyloides ratti]
MSVKKENDNIMDIENSEFIVPRVIESTSFLKERINLLADIYDAIGSKVPSDVKPSMPRTLLQRLPRHMRRRAMSHNIKRLPVAMRKFGKNHLSKSKHRKKAPSRYWRRRPINLYKNYIQRQRLYRWLETHIWHAKRFRMKAIWGFKIPDKSFQRSHRPIYRSSKIHSTVIDISYLKCIQIIGDSQESIIDKMNLCCGVGKLPSFSFKPAKNGLFEKTIMFYTKNKYPFGFIGPIRFLWAEDESETKSLILWIHPSIFEKVMDNLKNIFSLSPQPHIVKDKKPITINDYKSLNKNTIIERYNGDGVVVNDISDEVNRFRLCGPKALHILLRTFKITSVNGNILSFLSDSSSSGNCQPNRIFSLTVTRPNMIKRKGLLSNLESLTNISINDKEIFQFHEFGIDEEKYINKYGENGLKIYLVNRKAQKNGTLSVYDGFDIIIPKIFAREFWQNIQLSSGHVSGLHSMKHLVYESSQFNFPFDVPDSVISKVEELNETVELKTIYEKRPWNRRKQYWRTFKIMFPFSFEWHRLLFEWNKEKLNINEMEEDIFVIRDRMTLKIIDCYVKNKLTSLPDELITTNRMGLVPVSIIPNSRGIPKRYAIICNSYDEETGKNDVISMKEVINNDKKNNKDDLKEICEDEFVWKPISLLKMFPSEWNNKKGKEMSRKKLKKDKIKNRLERQQKRLAIEKKECEERASLTYIKSSPPYQIIGRVVSGSYSFSKSHGHALGYISLLSLSQQLTRDKILFRNINSFNYFKATISVISDESLEL